MDKTQKKHFQMICPSSRDFYRKSRANPNHTFGDFVHGYVYGRWTYTYISVAKGKHPLTKILGPLFNFITRLFPKSSAEKKAGSGSETKISFADGYHGKVVPLEKASKLITVNRPINLPDLEKIIPYKRARSIILENPDHIAVLKCPCRAAMKNPCTPLEVCLIIGEPFVSFILEHHPDKARRIDQKEAVSIMKAEEHQGHVHHAFFKDAMLDRFYAICNCCSCCCGAINAHRNGTPMLASSGYVSRLNNELCVGCGTCADYCQFGAIGLRDDQIHIDVEQCMGCGVCAAKCEQEAITLERDPAKGEPLDIIALQSERGRI